MAVESKPTSYERNGNCCQLFSITISLFAEETQRSLNTRNNIRTSTRNLPEQFRIGETTCVEKLSITEMMQ